jgi:SNF2 family DNA or RNA helicase
MTGYEDRDYQQLGTNFLKAVRRGFLTDDPGLGKTIQAIRATELPALVVAPRYLSYQWEDAILQEDPTFKIARADGTRSERDAILSKHADWYIVNYEMLATYALPVGMRTFINDESHRLRNRNANQSIAAYEYETLKHPDARVYHLTATPMWKTPDDIWMQARILYPNVSVFQSYHKFVKLFCTTLRSPWGGPKVVGIKRYMRKPLQDLLAPIMLGRTYKDVGRFLPAMIETTVSLTLSVTQRQMYKELVDTYAVQYQEKRLIFEGTAVIHALRQITAHSGKFDAVMDILKDNNDHPAVIGFWYRDHAFAMYKMLGDKKAVLCTGDMDPVDRNALALKAQREGKHIVCTQESLKEGINLSKYRLFIFGEEHYVPEANRQFMTRVVRDRNDGGKDTEPVRVFYVQVKNTIDVTIHNVAKKRGAAISAVREILDRTLT